MDLPRITGRDLQEVARAEKSTARGAGRVGFVSETIFTSAMRVIHIIVKTEETQRLRIVFVLYCST